MHTGSLADSSNGAARAMLVRVPLAPDDARAALRAADDPVGVEHPRDVDRSVVAARFHPIDIERVDGVLTSTGHAVIPIHLLWRTYDGPNDFWRRRFPSERPPSWFIRFFDWV